VQRSCWCLISVLLLAGTFQPVAAQSRALVMFGFGGRMLTFTDLSVDNDNLGAGGTYGGGIGLQLGGSSALRASVTVADGEYDGPTLALSTPSIQKVFYSLDLMFGSPSDMGLAPYFFVGGGRVSLNPAEEGESNGSSLAGRAGVGVNFVPDNSFYVLFIEAVGWAYQFDALGFSRLQLNTALVGGLAFALPF